MGPYCEHEV